MNSKNAIIPAIGIREIVKKIALITSKTATNIIAKPEMGFTEDSLGI
jgi:hypothetical protein